MFRSIFNVKSAMRVILHNQSHWSMWNMAIFQHQPIYIVFLCHLYKPLNCIYLNNFNISNEWTKKHNTKRSVFILNRGNNKTNYLNWNHFKITFGNFKTFDQKIFCDRNFRILITISNRNQINTTNSNAFKNLWRVESWDLKFTSPYHALFLSNCK